MENQVIEEILDNLAERYIPEGTHRILHVDSREAWKNLMIALIESKLLRFKMSLLTKCAVSWEPLLYQKISLQN